MKICLHEVKQQVNAIYQQTCFGTCKLIIADAKTDQGRFYCRTALKGNCVAASPPGSSTPRKHGEMKGDMEICSDTAVSEQTHC